MLPLLDIYLDRIEGNARTVAALCAARGIEVTGVTKVACGSPEIAGAFLRAGIRRIGDSQPDNLERLSDLAAQRWMLRLPAVGEADRLVRQAEVSLNSEPAVLAALSQAAERHGLVHKVVLMADLGDLREGFIRHDELLAAAALVRSLPHLELYGVGVNLTCFSFVQPDTGKLETLVGLARSAGLPEGAVISGGNSATLDLLLRGGIPAGVNNLRLGESLLFGRERAQYRYLDNTRADAFLLEAEIVECKEKPSMPQGTIGRNSYGQQPTFRDRGMRRRAICAIGRQSVDPETMWPLEEGVEILGASSDHLVLDLTDSGNDYRVGDPVRFRLGYFAAMRAFTSPFVEKRYRNAGDD